MNPDSRSRLITAAEAVVVIAVLIAGIFFGWYYAHHGSFGPANNPNGTQTGATSTTHSAVSADTHVPTPGETSSDKSIAVPTIAVDAAPGVDAKRRSFDIAFDGKNFSPSQVIVNAGDTTSVHFTTSSGTCNFVQPDFGLSSTFTSAKPQLIEVTPDKSQSGKYTFYCSNLGGPSSGPVGAFVVVPKQ